MSEKTRTIIYRIIVIILIIIILLLLFFNRNNVGEINNYPMPTGNIDFFDIDVHTSLDYEEILPSGYPDTDSGASCSARIRYVPVSFLLPR